MGFPREDYEKSIRATIANLERQKKAALSQGNTTLASQIDNAIAQHQAQLQG